MGKKIIISLILTLIFSIPLFSYQSDKVFKKFDYSIANTDAKTFLEFVEEYKELDEKVKLDFRLKQSNLIKILNFEKKLFEYGPTDTLYSVHIKIKKMLSNNAELGEVIDELFSDFFIKNMKTSLCVLEGIQNEEDYNILVNSIVFVEGAAKKILKFIEESGLKNKAYYKTFIKYKS